MKNERIFETLRAATLATLCAGGLVLAVAGCTAESPSDGPVGTDGTVEKSCGDKGCGDKDGGADADADGEKACGEKGCGDKDDAGDNDGDKSCGDKGCGG